MTISSTRPTDNPNEWNIYPESLLGMRGNVWIFWKNLQGQFLGCNDFMAHSLKLTNRKKIIGRTDYDLPINANEIEHYIASDKNVLSSKITQQFFDTFSSQDNNLQLIAIKSPLIKNNEIMGIVGISYLQELRHDSRSKSSSNAQLAYADNEFNLSNQQEECLYYLVNGMTIKEIAKILTLSPKTVEHYLDAVKIKTNTHSRSELISKGLQLECIKQRLQQ